MITAAELRNIPPGIASLRAKEPTRVAQLDADDFRTLFAECNVFRGELLTAMTRRVTNLQKLAQTAPPPTATIIGHRYDVACHTLRDFLKHTRYLFDWKEVVNKDANERARAAA